MANIPGLKNLCTPAYVYLVISLIAIIVMAFQNISNTNMYCVGMYDCNVSSVFMVFLLKIIYVIFWTWVLNIICRGGAPGLAWFFVLLPFILMFLFIALMFLHR
jgi:hypothetical protein